MNYSHQQRGFIALMSTIVISAILIGLMMTASMASFYARYDALGIENKREALALAESCVQVALLALATSTDPLHYNPVQEIISVDTEAAGDSMDCTIKDITHNGQNITIDTYASSDNSFAGVSATASLSPNIRILFWNEQ